MALVIALLFSAASIIGGSPSPPPTTVAMLNDGATYEELFNYASSYNCTLRQIDVHTNRGKYYAMTGDVPVVQQMYAAYNAPSTSPGFVIETIAPYKAVFADPTDPLYVDQKSYLDQILAKQAWDGYGKGRATQVIAIVDSGMFYPPFPDLSNSWINTIDQPPSDDVDQDNNGFADDFYGWNVHDNNNDPHDIGIYNVDNDYHLSHGSGVWTTAAAPHNDFGIVGVVSNTRVLMVKAGYVSGGSVYFNMDSLIEAQDYILAQRQNGLNIVAQVASYGGSGFSLIFESAIADAIGSLMLMVASAGNNGRSVESSPMYPCAYTNPGIVCVGAVTLQNRRTSYSNYGSTTVDLSAPGTVLGLASRNNASVYVSMSGTSFSAPLVAGAVALIKGAKPELTAAKIKECLMDASTPASASLVTATNGILNVEAAAKMCVDGIMPSNPAPSPPSPRPGAGSSDALRVWCAILIAAL